MELMDTSLDQCYRHLYGVIQQSIPEDILGMTSLAVSYTSHCCNLVALTGTHYCPEMCVIYIPTHQNPRQRKCPAI